MTRHPAVLIAAVLIVSAACRGGPESDPWTTPPQTSAETREARWSQVVAFAAVPTERKPTADLLERAAAAARGARDDVPDALRDALVRQPGIHVDALPPATAGALANLVRWHTADGSLGAEVADARSLGSHRLIDSSVAREQAWVREFYGARLEDLAADPEDRAAVRRAVELSSATELPPSFVVRVSAHDLRFMLDRWYDTVERFDAVLDQAPR